MFYYCSKYKQKQDHSISGVSSFPIFSNFTQLILKSNMKYMTSKCCVLTAVGQNEPHHQFKYMYNDNIDIYNR